MTPITAAVEQRARQSLGRGHDAIHAMVARLLAARQASGMLADIGCGTGDLVRAVNGQFRAVTSVDAVRYDGLPEHVTFVQADLDAPPLPLDDCCADVTAAV